MEGLSAELDFALKSRDPYPINLESLVDLLKYKHISSLTTHLKRHFQRDVDYKKFHQVRNKRQICVYYISVDCFKQICGFCRHTQRKEIAQNLLGNMSIDMKSQSDEMSFTEMLNDINELNHGDDSEEEDDLKMRQSSPPSKSIKIEKGNFVTKDPQSLFTRYGRTQLQSNMAMMKRGGAISDSTTTTNAPSFSNNIYNFNNLSAGAGAQSITPIIPTPLTSNNKSALTSALAGTAFPSTFNPSSLTANALANAAISNTNNSAFIINNNNNNAFSFNYPTNTYPNYIFNSTATPSAFTPSTTSISSFSSNSATINPVTNINTIVPFNNLNSSNPIPINNNITTFAPTQFTSNPITLDTTTSTILPTPINTHKRTSSSRGSPIPSNPSKPITHVTSTITPTPIISQSALATSTTTPITAPITATPVLSTAPTPFSVASNTQSVSLTSSGSLKSVNTITPVKSPAPPSPAMGRLTTATPPTKSGVTKFFGFGSFGKTGNYLNTMKPNEQQQQQQEFKVDDDGSLFDLTGLAAPSDMQFYDDYLTLSSSPTSLFDPINTLAEVDKIYEQWEQERGGPRLFE